jgi:chromosome segregation ATPase
LREQVVGLHAEVEQLRGEIARRELESQALRTRIDQDRKREQDLRAMMTSVNMQCNGLRASHASALDESARLRSLVAAMEGTRTMRWTRRLRSRYAMMRGRFSKGTP